MNPFDLNPPLRLTQTFMEASADARELTMELHRHPSLKDDPVWMETYRAAIKAMLDANDALNALRHKQEADREQ